MLCSSTVHSRITRLLLQNRSQESIPWQLSCCNSVETHLSSDLPASHFQHSHCFASQLRGHDSLESQAESSVFRQYSLTDLYHSDGLRASFYQSMFTLPRKLYSCSKETLIYLILIVVFLKYRNLDRHFVYLKKRYLEKIQVFPLTWRVSFQLSCL